MQYFRDSLEWTDLAVRTIGDNFITNEENISLFQQLFSGTDQLLSSATVGKKAIAGLPSRLGELESRSRPNNLIIYGFADDQENRCLPLSTNNMCLLRIHQ